MRDASGYSRGSSSTRRLVSLVGATAALAVCAASAATGSAQQTRLGWSFPSVVNDDGRATDQHSPNLVADTAGNVHAAWVDYRNGGGGGEIYYSRLRMGSEHWDGNMRVAGGDTDVARSAPVVAVDSQSGVHVVWAEARGVSPDIMHRLLPQGSRVWSAPARVNDDHGPAAQLDPRVVADNWGSIHVVWTDHRAGTARLYHAQRLYDGEWMPNKPITERVQGMQENPELAITKHGDVYALWEESRSGKTDIYASRLPPGSQVWWPPHELSTSPSSSREYGVSAAADSEATMHAVWIADDEPLGVLRAASLPADEEMWQTDRVVYRPTRGELESVTVAAGPGGRALAVWAETRPEGWRLYSGLLGSELVPERVDGTPYVIDSREPVAAIDARAEAHVAWTGTIRNGEVELLHASGSLPAPAYEEVEYEGYVQYRYGEWNCAGDGHMIMDCDGGNSPFVASEQVDLGRYLGSYVRLSGLKVDDTPCIHVRATTAKRVKSPCPKSTGSVTGLLSLPTGPAWGAHVFLGEEETYTGPSGRFYFDDVEPVGYPLTATLSCALGLGSGGVQVRSGVVTVADDALFTVGEVVDDDRIDVRDMVRVTAQYKSQPPFNPPCSDQDGDGVISLADVVVVAASYGSVGPSQWGAEHDALAAPGPNRVGTTQWGAESSPCPAPSELSTPRSEAQSGTGARRRMLLVSGVDGVFGWSAELQYDPSGILPLDVDGTEIGVQPFDLDSLSTQVWVIENAATEAKDSARLTLAATLVAPAPPLPSGAVLGAFEFETREGLLPQSAGPMLERFLLLDSAGRPVRGQLLLAPSRPRGNSVRLALPWLSR